MEKISVNNTVVPNKLFVNGSMRTLYPFVANVQWFRYKNKKYFVVEKLWAREDDFFTYRVFRYPFKKSKHPNVDFRELGIRLQEIVKKYQSKFDGVYFSEVYTLDDGRFYVPKPHFTAVRVKNETVEKLPQEFWDEVFTEYTNFLLSKNDFGYEIPYINEDYNSEMIIWGIAFKQI